MKQLEDIILLIGKTRFIRLVIAIAAALILVFLWQQVIVPASEEIERENQTIASERSRLQRELVDMPVRYKTLKENESRYEELMQGSFISSQDRISARTRVEGLRLRAGLQDMSYTIAPLETITDQSTQGVESAFVRSKVSLTMRGVTDIEMRDFIDLMREDFGGLVILRSLDLRRDQDFTPENLKRLSRGDKVDFVSGKADLEWYSVLPAVTEAPSGPEHTAGGLPR